MKSFAYFICACAGLWAPAQAQTMQDALSANSASERFFLYDKLARQGNVEAQYELSSAYEGGYGTVRNYNEAFRWAYLASQSGYGRAQYRLGGLYFRGIGTPVNYGRAYSWLIIADANKYKDGVNFIRDAEENLDHAQINYYQRQALECQQKKFVNCDIR